jgi:hypothetical protein
MGKRNKTRRTTIFFITLPPLMKPIISQFKTKGVNSDHADRGGRIVPGQRIRAWGAA